MISFVAIFQQGKAQAPPPAPDNKGSIANQSPGGPLGAPIDGGLTVFIVFAAGYAGWEWAKSRKSVWSAGR